MKKVLLVVGAFAIALATVPMFAAFEAHVINVTARIENALNVNTEPISFGTVFPEEFLFRNFTMRLSDSFLADQDANDVEYVIKQKPKCADDALNPTEYSRVTEDERGNFICENENHVILPVLCPYLSKHSLDQDSNDGFINAGHGSIDWTPTDTESTKVAGVLIKSQQDISDSWLIDLFVPCFEGQCAQDNLVPAQYQQPKENEHKVFGCDLWIEVTGISLLSDQVD